MSQDLGVVESEDACHALHIRLRPIHRKHFPKISLLKLTVQLEFNVTAETEDQFCLLPNRLT